MMMLLMMVNLSFPRYTMLLSDPNIWLADTVATIHMMPYQAGLIVTKRATKETLLRLEMELVLWCCRS